MEHESKKKERHTGFTLREETAFGDFIRTHNIALSRLKASKRIIEALWCLAFDLGKELQWENTRRLLCHDCAAGVVVEDIDGAPIHTIERVLGAEVQPWRRLCTAREIYAIRPLPRN